MGSRLLGQLASDLNCSLLTLCDCSLSACRVQSRVDRCRDRSVELVTDGFSDSEL